MTYLLLLVAIFIWPFGQLLVFQTSGLLGNIYLLDIVLGFLAISLSIQKKHRNRIIVDPLFKPLLIFTLLALFSLMVNSKSLMSGGLIYSLLYLGRLFIYPSAYFAVKIFSSRPVFKSILFSFAVFCFVAILQYIFIPDMRFLKLIGFDDHYFRLIGSFYDPNFTGAILAATSLFFIALGNWLISLPLLVMLALTFSRASFLCFSIGLVYLMFAKKKYWLFIFLLALGMMIWLIPKPFGEGVNLLRIFSIISRFESWENGLHLFLQKPFFGWGYNTLRSISGERFQIDNSYIFIAATTGIVGLLAFVSLLLKSLQGLVLPKKLFIITLLLHSLFNNSFFYIWINLAFWVILALPLKGYKQE